MNFEERAREIVRTAVKDHDDGGYQYASLNETLGLRFAQALRDAYAEGLEDAAKKLDAAAEHQAMVDKHPAWDSTRVDAEPCEEHGHVYHSYPGYAAHVVSQMATVVRNLKDAKGEE